MTDLNCWVCNADSESAISHDMGINYIGYEAKKVCYGKHDMIGNRHWHNIWGWKRRWTYGFIEKDITAGTENINYW